MSEPKEPLIFLKPYTPEGAAAKKAAEEAAKFNIPTKKTDPELVRSIIESNDPSKKTRPIRYKGGKQKTVKRRRRLYHKKRRTYRR